MNFWALREARNLRSSSVVCHRFSGHWHLAWVSAWWIRLSKFFAFSLLSTNLLARYFLVKSFLPVCLCIDIRHFQYSIVLYSMHSMHKVFFAAFFKAIYQYCPFNFGLYHFLVFADSLVYWWTKNLRRSTEHQQCLDMSNNVLPAFRHLSDKF